MSNEYYTSPTDIAPAGKVRSSQINDMDAAIDAAFDNIPTSMSALKAEIVAARDGETDLDTRISTAETGAGASATAAAASATASANSATSSSSSASDSAASATESSGYATNSAASAAAAQALVDSSIAEGINGATAKTTLVGGDKIGLVDSEDSNALKKVTMESFRLDQKETLRQAFLL